MFVLHGFVYIVCVVLLFSVILPAVKSDFWVFRVFEYLRFQKLLAAIGCLLVLTVLQSWHTTTGTIFMAIIGAVCLYLLAKVLPYTILGKKEMEYAGDSSREGLLNIFTANVYQYNNRYSEFMEMIKRTNPDVVFLVETDSKWGQALQPLADIYPHQQHSILDNTYGLMFFSKLPVISSKINYLVEEDVPSIDAVVQLPNKTRIQLWGLHPKPPVPAENLRSTAKDKELMKIAFKAKESRLPVIVFGDLNDVAWSYVTKLFRKVSGLLDPRRGRGFYSTFHANKWYMRFPLDYIFASEHFKLVRMRRLPATGSDHFPILTALQFHPHHALVQDGADADAEDIQQAREIASKQVEDN